MVILTKELFVNGELTLSRKETYGKNKQIKSEQVFTSRMEKHQYYKNLNHFDVRNVLDVKGFLKDISANWNTYVSQVNQWIQKNPAKRLVVSGIFTVVLGFFASTSNAAFIQEYTYQVKNGEKIENIATEHGVTVQEILDANGLSSIDGKKILLPKVQDTTVTATILNVRSKPNAESSIIGQYKKGDVVKVSFVENGWAGILIKGRVCFVSADYLTQEQAVASTASETTRTAKSQAKTMYVTAPSLRVREAASTSSTVLGSLKSNDSVSVASTFNGWAQINFKGKVAFVSETHLTNNEPTKNETSKNNNTNTKTSSSVYVIKSGDTFTKISKALGISVPSIQELNPTVDSSKLKIGQEVKIPTTTAQPQAKTMYVTASSLRVREAASTSSAVLGWLKSNDSVSATSTFNGWAQINFKGKVAFVSETYLTNNESTKNETSKNNNTNTKTSSSVYVIKSGDTFTKISKALGISVLSIQELNPTVDSSKLKIGQRIKIPTTTAPTTNQIKVAAQIGGIDPQGTFHFITSDGSTYVAKASGNMLTELFEHKEEKVTLTLDGKRGQQMTLTSLQ